MGDRSMAPLAEDARLHYALGALISASVALLSLFVPFENLLSEYVVTRSFYWYPAWRVAVSTLLLWLASVALSTVESRISKPLLASSCAIFVIAHYSLLYAISGYSSERLGISCRVELLPLCYRTTCTFAKGFSANTYYLDLGQVLTLATLASFVQPGELFKKLASLLKK